MKNRLVFIFSLGLLLAPLGAQALPMVFTASLDGLSEVPPNASPGDGGVTVTVDDVLKTMRVQASFMSLIGAATAAHIHCCAPPGVNTGVASGLTGFPVAVTSGVYDMSFDMTMASSYFASFITANGGTPDSAFSALLAGMNAGNAYVNVHTTFVPAGEVRGNLQRRADVPVPGSSLLLILGLAALGLRRQFAPA